MDIKVLKSTDVQVPDFQSEDEKDYDIVNNDNGATFFHCPPNFLQGNRKHARMLDDLVISIRQATKFVEEVQRGIRRGNLEKTSTPD